MLRVIHLLLLGYLAMASPVVVEEEDREDMEAWERLMDERDGLQEELLDQEEEEEEDRLGRPYLSKDEDEEEEEDRLGRPAGPDVECGKWTNRVVDVNETTMSTMKTFGYTMRCTVLFKPVAPCGQVSLTCDDKFFVDNRDPWKCDIGDVFQTRIDDGKPHRFCKYDGPSYNFPVLSKGNLKADYKRSIGVLGVGRFPNKGIKCTAKCNQLASNGTMYY